MQLKEGNNITANNTETKNNTVSRLDENNNSLESKDIYKNSLLEIIISNNNTINNLYSKIRKEKPNFSFTEDAINIITDENLDEKIKTINLNNIIRNIQSMISILEQSVEIQEKLFETQQMLDFRNEIGQALVPGKSKEEVATAIERAMQILEKYITANSFSLRAYSRKKKILKPIINNDGEEHSDIDLANIDKNTQTALTHFLENCKASDCREPDKNNRKPIFFKKEDYFTAIFPIYNHEGKFDSMATFHFDKDADTDVIEKKCNTYYQLFGEVSDKFRSSLAKLNKVQKKASTDALTGINNRGAFDAKLLEVISSAERYNSKFSMSIFDIDHFKKFNDTYGHQAGDKVLKDLANCVRAELRKTDFFARYGGEEFILIFPETDLNAAALVTERIRQSISNLFFSFENDKTKKMETPQVTSSFGIVQYQSGNNSDQLINLADAALYRSKQNGRNQVNLNNRGSFERYEEKTKVKSLGSDYLPNGLVQNLNTTKAVKIEA